VDEWLPVICITVACERPPPVPLPKVPAA
jgi:hypothetical protein